MTLDKLRAAVEHNTTVVDSAIVLIQQIADQLRTFPSQADVDAFADALDAEAQKLADAVTANTPSA